MSPCNIFCNSVKIIYYTNPHKYLLVKNIINKFSARTSMHQHVQFSQFYSIGASVKKKIQKMLGPPCLNNVQCTYVDCRVATKKHC